jgi:tetratricopeptide (TPR) repeat protein
MARMDLIMRPSRFPLQFGPRSHFMEFMLGWARSIGLSLAVHFVPSVAAEASPGVTTVGSLETDIIRWTMRTTDHPKDAAAWVNLGDALMQRSRDRMDAALHDGAEAAYRQALGVDARRVAALVGMAWVANTRHDFANGRRWCREALAVQPATPEAHALLGDAAVELGEYDDALEHFQSALDLRPDLASYARSAHVLWLTGDSRRAQALMHRAIQSGGPHPENVAWCRAELGRMMFCEGALLPAEGQVNQALREAPENPFVLAMAGRIKAAKKDYASAIATYEKAVAIAPQHASMAALVDLYRLTGDPGRGERMTTRLIAFHEGHARAHVHSAGASPGSHAHGNSDLARFLADQDRDLDRALAEAEASAQESRSVAVFDTLAWCHYRKGQYAEASRWIRRALRWNTPDAVMLYHAGMIQAALGDTVAARKSLYQAINLNPRFDPVHADLASAKVAELSRAWAAQQAGVTVAP